MSQQEDSGSSPLAGTICFVVVAGGICKGVHSWLLRNEGIIMNVIFGIFKFFLIVGALTFVGYLLYKLIESICIWIGDVTRTLIKSENDIKEHDDRLSRHSVEIACQERQLRDLEQIVNEIRKFTKFDEEKEKQKKLKDAMASVGAKEPVVSEKEFEAAERQMFSSMTEAELETNIQRLDVSKSY